MIESHHVKQLQHMTQSCGPPSVMRAFVDIPSVQRVSPELTGLTKIIRRSARHKRGLSLFIQIKESLVGPHIGAVVSHINRQIPNQANSSALAMGAQSLP